MKIKKLYFLDKDIIFLVIALFFSLNIFFSNDSKYVLNVERKIIDFVSYIVYPKSWYKDIMVIKSENEILKQKVVQLKLLN